VGYFQSLDGGQTWTTVTTATSCGGINGVLFDPSGSTIYLAGSSGVCRSADGGTTWTAANVGYLSAVESLLLDPVDHSTLYAAASPGVPGGTGGVYRSRDGGHTWEAFGEGLPPDVSASKLAADRRGDPSLYVGTQGEGVASIVVFADRPPVEAPPAQALTVVINWPVLVNKAK